MREVPAVDQRHKNELLSKFSSNSLRYEEAEELRSILEQERRQAASLGNLVAVIAIGVLIAAIIAFLSKLSSK